MDGIYNRIIEKEALKGLQDKFCVTAGLYAMCLDSEGAVLTEMSGEQEDKDRPENRYMPCMTGWKEAVWKNRRWKTQKMTP